MTAGGDRYIITADRDEKIRVSMYPRAYIIHSYCLGHTQYARAILRGLRTTRTLTQDRPFSHDAAP